MRIKHYKPGQIVTIDRCRYRIKKGSEHPCNPCWECLYEHLSAAYEPCRFCMRNLFGLGLYLERFRKRLCGSQGK